jgi:two-component system chemotaxis response regulator CheB
VIGTSAGGVQALTTLVAGLPKTLPAAVFVVIHIPGWWPSALPGMLSRNGRLTVSSPEANQPFQRGHLYLALADLHMVLEPNERIELSHGPKEGLFRPAINPLFRSAAEIYRDRVIGVILTGYLDDGVAGLASVKQHGGVAVVQDPNDAAAYNMPRAALLNVKVDHVAAISDMSELLIQLVSTV